MSFFIHPKTNQRESIGLRIIEQALKRITGFVGEETSEIISVP